MTREADPRADPPSAGVDRRSVLRAAAWSVPVIAAATAVPQASASNQGTVPVATLTVSSFPLSNLQQYPDGRGPLEWAGGQVQYHDVEGSPPATVPVVITLTGPDGQPLVPSTNVPVVLDNHETSQTVGNFRYDPGPPLAPGVYTVTVVAFGSDGSKSAVSMVTLT